VETWAPGLTGQGRSGGHGSGAGRGGSGASSGGRPAVWRRRSAAGRGVGGASHGSSASSVAARSACVIGNVWRSWEGREASWCPAASGLY